MTKLQVFSNGADYVIAENLDEAFSLLPYLEDMHKDEWGLEPMDGTFSIWLDFDDTVAEHGTGNLIARSWQQWIKTFGKGYVCVVEC